MRTGTFTCDASATASVPVFLAVGSDKQFGLLCNHLRIAALATHPRFETPGRRSMTQAALREPIRRASVS